MFAGCDVDVFSIYNRITQMYFDLVVSGCNVQDLRMIVERGRRPDLQAIYKNRGIHGGAGHDDLGGIRDRGFLRREPSTARQGE